MSVDMSAEFRPIYRPSIGRDIGRLSVDILADSIDRYSVDIDAHDPPNVGKVSANCRPSGGEVSAGCRPTCVSVDVGRYVGRISADILAEYRSRYRPILGRQMPEVHMIPVFISEDRGGQFHFNIPNTARQRIGSDLRYFFQVFLCWLCCEWSTPECRVQ